MMDDAEKVVHHAEAIAQGAAAGRQVGERMNAFFTMLEQIADDLQRAGVQINPYLAAAAKKLREEADHLEGRITE